MTASIRSPAQSSCAGHRAPAIQRRYPRQGVICAACARTRRQGGFSLIEVLVAIVVLSLGLLGLAGLQVSSLNNNQAALYRSIATQQAYDIAERMRANPRGVSGGHYINPPAPTSNCIGRVCTPAQMAHADFAQWNHNNQRLLPDGRGQLVRLTNNTYRITVSWTERTITGNTTQSFVTTMSP